MLLFFTEKKFEQPCELTNKEGKTKAIRVSIGLTTWRKTGIYTKPWVQHSGQKITWSHVHGLQGFPVGVSKNGSSVRLSVCLSVCLPVCLSVCLPLCLSACVGLGPTHTPVTHIHHSHTYTTRHTGSMDLENFAKFAFYFVSNLPEGYGPGQKCVILILDGHSSRWDPVALHLFKSNNVHVWVIASHTSAWGQVRSS